jgi:hypothetical protein
MQSPVALQAQKFRSCLCADEMDAPIFAPSRDDVAGGPILHAQNVPVKARRVPSARPVIVVPQDEIHDVCLVVEQVEQTHPKHDARVAVPGCTARSAVARTRRHVAVRQPAGGKAFESELQLSMFFNPCLQSNVSLHTLLWCPCTPCFADTGSSCLRSIAPSRPESSTASEDSG